MNKTTKLRAIQIELFAEFDGEIDDAAIENEVLSLILPAVRFNILGTRELNEQTDVNEIEFFRKSAEFWAKQNAEDEQWLKENPHHLSKQ